MATPTQLKGSFRGVPFGLFTHTVDFGRNTVVHEFPFKDVPYVEDLGRKIRTFTLDLFVLGSDVAAQRDALRKALEQKGPGTLVHPYLGSLKVQVTAVSLSESFDAQRLAKFSVTFVQAGRLDFPSSSSNPAAVASNASTAASLQAGANATAIDTSSPQALAAMNLLVAPVASAVQTSAKRAALPNSLPLLTDQQTALDSMSAYVSDLGALPGLVSAPDLMSYSVADIIFRLSSLGMTSLQAFYAYQRLLGLVQPIFTGLNYPATAIGAVMSSNASLWQDAVYIAIVGSAAAVAVDADFTTNAQATAVRDALGAMFDVAMGVVTDDTLFGNLQDLRASSLPQIPDPSVSLPNVVSIRTPAPLPSLVLVHDLMSGSVDEQTVIDLNAAGNPWFIPSAPSTPVLILR